MSARIAAKLDSNAAVLALPASSIILRKLNHVGCWLHVSFTMLASAAVSRLTRSLNWLACREPEEDRRHKPACFQHQLYSYIADWFVASHKLDLKQLIIRAKRMPLIPHCAVHAVHMLLSVMQPFHLSRHALQQRARPQTFSRSTLITVSAAAEEHMHL